MAQSISSTAGFRVRIAAVSRRGARSICDYSRHLVASRPAKVGDKSVATDLTQSITRGFTAIGEPEVAVCLLPGAEFVFETAVQYGRAFSLFSKGGVAQKVARFRQINMDDPMCTTMRLNFQADSW